MSITTMTSSNSLTVKRWEKQGWIDIYKTSPLGLLFDKGVIFKADELNGAQRGDQTTFNYTGILTGLGTGEGGTLVGREEALDLSSDTMVWNVFRHAVNNPNNETIEQIRTYVPFEQRARELLVGYHRSRMTGSLFSQACGVTSTTITVDTTVYSGTNRAFVQGLNSATAPTSNRVVRAGGAANDQSLTSSNTLTTDLLDNSLELALTTYPTLIPLDGDEFCMFIHPYQLTDLKRDTSGKIQWYVNVLAQMEAGEAGTKNQPYMSLKPVCRYANIDIYVSNYVPSGQDSSTAATISTVKRAVLFGKNAIAFGSPFGGTLNNKEVPIKYFMQLQDYEYYKGIEARTLYGMKKVRFRSAGNTEDLGTIVVSTYAASH